MDTQNSPATYHFPPLVQGNTFRARVIATLTQDTVPLGISSALLEVRHKKTGTLLYEWKTTGGSPNATVTGDDLNAVTLGAVEPEITGAWPPGEYEYGLEVIFSADDAKLTILAGKFPIKPRAPRNS